MAIEKCLSCFTDRRTCLYASGLDLCLSVCVYKDDGYVHSSVSGRVSGGGLLRMSRGHLYSRAVLRRYVLS